MGNTEGRETDPRAPRGHESSVRGIAREKQCMSGRERWRILIDSGRKQRRMTSKIASDRREPYLWSQSKPPVTLRFLPLQYPILPRVSGKLREKVPERLAQSLSPREGRYSLSKSASVVLAFAVSVRHRLDGRNSFHVAAHGALRQALAGTRRRRNRAFLHPTVAGRQPLRLRSVDVAGAGQAHRTRHPRVSELRDQNGPPEKSSGLFALRI